MQVYRAKFHSPQLFYVVRWFATQVEATAWLDAMKQERSTPPVTLFGDGVAALEFPGTDTAAALSFLNTNCGLLPFTRPGYWTAIIPPEG